MILSYLPDIYLEGASPSELIAALAEVGAGKLVFPHSFFRKWLAGEIDFAKTVDVAASSGAPFSDAHAPYNADFDLNGNASQIENHKRMIDLCASAGIRTYTIHIGPPYGGQTPLQALSQSCRSVEKLLPLAEESKTTLCVENIYYPTTTVPLLHKLLTTFQSTYFRFCYDSGHANIMTRGVRDKSHVDWVRKYWEDSGITPECDDFSALHPFLATCHLHDNSGASDDHTLPGYDGGNIDWKSLLEWITSSPSLISMQTESHGAAYRKTAADTVAAYNAVNLA